MRNSIKMLKQKFGLVFAVGLGVIVMSGCSKEPLNEQNDLKSLPIAYEGYTGIYPNYSLVLDEQFDEFNTDIWQKGDGAVGGESVCRFQPQGIQVIDGILNFIIKEETIAPGWSKDHQQQKGPYEFSCGEVRTRENKKIRYGRFETRMRAPDRQTASGYISSLFTYTNEGDPREWEEIDVELEGGRPDKFQANLIYGKGVWDWPATRQWGAWEDKIETAPADEWRVYAFEWTPTYIKWFVDGVLTKTLTQEDLDCQPECVPPQINPTPIPDNNTLLMMNFWIPNDEIEAVFGGVKKDNVYPMRAQYDWIRIYQMDAHPFTQWE
ncbi:MAG: endo-1,3-1,4-beta-glycanase ExoK [Glaciecola sp.]|jgi:endo-1,3-1,4-beta-glycanase ExoK